VWEISEEWTLTSRLLLGPKQVKRPKTLQRIIMMMMVKSTRHGFSTDDQNMGNKIVVSFVIT
jgi:hypothetical protein